MKKRRKLLTDEHYFLAPMLNVPALLALSRFPILRFDQATPLGTGPFRVTRSSENRTTLEAFDPYWHRIDENYGLFWPCPEPGHPGTPRLYEGGKFGHPDGKAHFIPIEWRPSPSPHAPARTS